MNKEVEIEFNTDQKEDKPQEWNFSWWGNEFRVSLEITDELFN